jgi:hypothetical protein
MERLTLDDTIKALRCVASQDTGGGCYADHENFIHMDDEYKRIVCGTGEDLRDPISDKEAVGCPYYQDTYECCFEDGGLYWLKDVAELLEELKSYKDLEEHGLLVRLPDDLNRVLYQINYRWTECTEYGEENNKCEIYDCKCECDSKKEYYITEVGFQYISTGNYYDRLGKTIFLTREEAKKKLEEMKNDKA